MGRWSSFHTLNSFLLQSFAFTFTIFLPLSTKLFSFTLPVSLSLCNCASCSRLRSRSNSVSRSCSRRRCWSRSLSKFSLDEEIGSGPGAGRAAGRLLDRGLALASYSRPDEAEDVWDKSSAERPAREGATWADRSGIGRSDPRWACNRSSSHGRPSPQLEAAGVELYHLESELPVVLFHRKDGPAVGSLLGFLCSVFLKLIPNILLTTVAICSNFPRISSTRRRTPILQPHIVHAARYTTCGVDGIFLLSFQVLCVEL